MYADGFANIDLGHYTLRGHYALGSIVSHFILDEVKSMFAEQAVESDPEHHEGNDEWDRYVLGDKDAGARFDQASFDAYVNDIESWRDERMWGSELYYSDIPRVSPPQQSQFAQTSLIHNDRSACSNLSTGTQRRLCHNRDANRLPGRRRRLNSIA